jgi:hypothetical protein
MDGALNSKRTKNGGGLLRTKSRGQDREGDQASHVVVRRYYDFVDK